MNILIVNDDGIAAEGIALLARAAKLFGKVCVFAPKEQCSAMSQRIILNRSIAVEPVDFPVENVAAYSVDGTPADCVRAAIAILPEKPDAVFSGVNRGYNIGFDIAYSGTVAAAMEARMAGIPAFAFSRDEHGTNSILEQNLPDVIARLLKMEISPAEIWNANFPGCPAENLGGIVWDCETAKEEYYNGKMRVMSTGKGWKVNYPTSFDEDTPLVRGAENTDLRGACEKKITISRIRCRVL